MVLVDKPAGPSSHALVEELRRRTGARTGHAGTLDPFATGLMVLLSGMSTKLAPCFVGLDKRYVTDVDLTSTTTTGDPEGEPSGRHDPPSQEELDARLEALRGEVELPIPAASKFAMPMRCGSMRPLWAGRRAASLRTCPTMSRPPSSCPGSSPRNASRGWC